MDNSNGAHYIPCDVKNNLNLMAMEQGLYAQVIMLSPEGLKVLHHIGTKMKLNLSFKVNIQYHNDGLILT